MVGAMAAAVILAMLPLIFILLNLILKGASSLNWAFFVEMPAPAGQSGGGVGHAIVGTLIIVGVACLIGLPIGIGAGVYSAEYPANRLAWISRFTADVMNGTWALIVANQKHFSALAGSVALALLLIPMVMRTTEEMVKLVPDTLREAALALGYPRWRTSLRVVLRTALPGIVTGSLLAVARIAGETAPLLFTALGSQFFSANPNQPMAALPLVVFTYASGPYEEWHRLAWAAALVLIMVVFVLSLGARIATRQRFNLNA
jgi:phosphate transport system permease protein